MVRSPSPTWWGPLRRHGEVPFADILAPSQGGKVKVYIPPPTYPLEDGFSFDLSCLVTNYRSLTFSPSKPFNFDTLQQGSTLDHAQGIALVGALSRSLGSIQGPPGTGKSFTGVAIIKALLENRKAAHIGTISTYWPDHLRLLHQSRTGSIA